MKAAIIDLTNRLSAMTMQVIQRSRTQKTCYIYGPDERILLNKKSNARV